MEIFAILPCEKQLHSVSFLQTLTSVINVNSTRSFSQCS